MKKVYRMSSVVFLLFTFSTTISLPSMGLVKPDLPVHNIDTGLDYATIQEAIDASDTLDGHTIFVDARIYPENVVVSKSVALVGSNRDTTVIDGRGVGDVVTVTAHNVAISGFTIRNGYLKGIDVNSFDGNKITDNIVSDNLAHGIHISNSSNNIVTGNILYSNWNGIFFQESKSDSISHNNASHNKGDGMLLSDVFDSTIAGNIASNNQWVGIYLRASSNNTFNRNTLSRNKYSGISIETIKIEDNLYLSANNTFSNNNVLNNPTGIYFAMSNDNSFFNNNFVNNTQQVYDEPFAQESPSMNIWDNGYPLGGNYWGDYTGTDVLTGSYQNETGRDGIGDTPYIINEYNQDKYPLMGFFSHFNISISHHVYVISNSTIQSFECFEFNSTIRMYVSNSSATQIYGFCRVSIPKNLISPPYTVIIDDGLAEVFYFNEMIYDNSTHRWIYFAYEHSTHELVIHGDNTPPTICILSPENKTYSVNHVPLTFTVDEATFWIACSLDGQNNVTITGNTTLYGLSDGAHYVIVYANDTAGNMGASSKVYSVVDTTPPEIADVSQVPLQSIVQPEDKVKVNATVTDALSGVKQVILNYTYTNGTEKWIKIVNMTNFEGNLWNATLPEFPYCTDVTYMLKAEDNVGNIITTHEMGYEYQYHVVLEFRLLIILPIFVTTTLVAIIVHRRAGCHRGKKRPMGDDTNKKVSGAR